MAGLRQVPVVNEVEAAVIRVLREHGAMSPSLLAAHLLTPRVELDPLLREMADRDLLIFRSDPTSVDGKLVILTSVGERGVKRIA